MATYPYDTSSPTEADVTTASALSAFHETAGKALAEARKTLDANASGKRIDEHAQELEHDAKLQRDWAGWWAAQKLYLAALKAAGDAYRKTLDDGKASNEDLAAAKKKVTEARTALAAAQKACDEAKKAVADARADDPQSGTLKTANDELTKAIAAVTAAKKALDDAIAEVKRIEGVQKQGKETWDKAAGKAKEKLGTHALPVRDGSRTLGTDAAPVQAPATPSKPTSPASTPSKPSGTPGGTPSGTTKPTGTPSGSGTPGSTPAGTTKPTGATPSGTKPTGTETPAGTTQPSKATPDLASLLNAAGQQGQGQPQQAQAQPSAMPQSQQPAASQAQQKPSEDKEKDRDSGLPTGTGPGGALTAGDFTAVGLNLADPAPTPAPRSATPTMPNMMTSPAAQQAGVVPTPRPLSVAQAPLTTGNSAGGLSTAAEVSGRTGAPNSAFSAPAPATSTSGAHDSSSQANALGKGGVGTPGGTGMPPMGMAPMGGAGGGGRSGKDKDRDQILSTSSDPSVAVIQGDAALADAVPHGTIARKA